MSTIKSLIEQILEKAGATHGVQVIQGNLSEVIAQLREEAEEVAETVGQAARNGADTGINVIHQLISDLQAEFGGQEGVELTHRELTLEEMEAEILAMLAEGEEDDRSIEELSHGELLELIEIQDMTLDVATQAVEGLREEIAGKDEMISQLQATVNLQSSLLEHSNAQLTAMHEGVAQLKGLLEVVKGANAKIDTHTRTISFADLLRSMGKN